MQKWIAALVCVVAVGCGEEGPEVDGRQLPHEDGGELIEQGEDASLPGLQADGGERESDAAIDAGALEADASGDAAIADGGASDAATRANTFAGIHEVMDILDAKCASCHAPRGQLHGYSEPKLGSSGIGEFYPTATASPKCGLPVAKPSHPEQSAMWLVFQVNASPCSPHEALTNKLTQHELDQVEDWIAAGAVVQ